MFNKAIKMLIGIIVTLIAVLLLAYGVSKSDFNNLKKYDEKDNSISDIRSRMQNPSEQKKKIAEERYYTTKVRIKEGSMASLGDFTVNIAGMFSMIGALFDSTNKEIIGDIKLDKDIRELVINRKGRFLSSLLKSEESERAYLKRLFMENFDKIDLVDVIYTLGLNGIGIDKDKL